MTAYCCPVHGRFESWIDAAEVGCPAVGDRYTRPENGVLVMRSSMRPGFTYRCEHPSPRQSIANTPAGCGPVPLPSGEFPTMPGIGQDPSGMTADGMIAYARRLVSITEAATAFVLAHCEFESRDRPQTMRDLVMDLHGKLERAVLGDEQVPGRRTR